MPLLADAGFPEKVRYVGHGNELVGTHTLEVAFVEGLVAVAYDLLVVFHQRVETRKSA